MYRNGDTMTPMSKPNCVGALIRDRNNCVYLQRRSMKRRQLPGAWDIVGGHVEPDETPERALAREVSEETGWRLRRIEAIIADWEWTHNGVTRRELDYLVEVDGDLSSPRLEVGKHDTFCWVGYKNLDGVRSKYDAGNDMLWNIVRRAARVRLTNDLRLEPIGATAADDLRRLCRAGVLTLDNRAQDRLPSFAAEFARLWETGGGYNWIAYWRKGRQSPIGHGGLVRRSLGGADQFLLQCAVLADERQVDAAEEIVKAILAFARHELGVDMVFACVSPPGRWAAEIMDRSGMRRKGSYQSCDKSTDVYGISFLEDSSYDLDQEVVTGIGQILAIPN
jgi:8-oxo-dGTP pyrophosphatase MutT (NUDIX family)